ncbi:methyl-accepting chemotaxis protein [Ferrimonas aestuarii]|uniref:Methyl-accepting chemotaxis protein n=1 Tax=Ferrimonas aestuarii TaxID=2569539 RepID=A0A4U1BN47_9GAMM|nr:methyl-accepting chemotaxis protein [Ferrimonas aestuarii]TKB54946.1 methyl-accepting chemotaxis protein [Ferrimonas aestuarii]
MQSLNNWSINTKLVTGTTFAVLLSTILIGLIAQWQIKTVLTHRHVDVEMPTMLTKISNQIDYEVHTLLEAAEQVANSPFVREEIQPQNINENTESRLVAHLNAIRDQYDLNDASVANRDTAYYWNQNGFLRELNHSQDSWFFNFIGSNQPTMVSMFQEANGEVKMFANFQSTSKGTLSGLSKSMDDMVSLLNGFKIEETGYVFLADAQGIIKIHKHTDKNGSSLQNLYGNDVNQLLNKSSFNLIRTQVNGEEVFVSSSYIKSMDWFLIGVAPVDEVFAELNSIMQKIMITTLIIAAVFILVSMGFAKTISQPIRAIAERFQNLGEANGDLAQRIDVNGNDEIAQLARGFNNFIAKIHQSMIEVAAASQELHNAAEGVSTKANTTHSNSQIQRDQTVQVVASINEMGQTISEIASNAATAADTANQASMESGNGQTVVTQSKEAITRLAMDLENTTAVVEQLASGTQEIGSILEVIRSISEQTNLLALNAAIEAARAGEQGRGFAVVADEVRSLASRTAGSTEEIQKMINRLQDDAQQAVAAMDAGKTISQEGVTRSDEAVEVLAQISQHIVEITDRNNHVATATEEQSTVVYTINQNIEEINSVNTQTTETASELATASQELQSLSVRLGHLVGGFKL